MQTLQPSSTDSPSLLTFFFSVRSFVNVGAKMFTRRAVQTGAFSPVTPYPTSTPPPETGPLHSSISGQSQTSIPQCISTPLAHVAFKPHRHRMSHEKCRKYTTDDLAGTRMALFCCLKLKEGRGAERSLSEGSPHNWTWRVFSLTGVSDIWRRIISLWMHQCWISSEKNKNAYCSPSVLKMVLLTGSIKTSVWDSVWARAGRPTEAPGKLGL